MCKNLIAFARQIANLDECQCQCQPTYLPASLPACLLACGGGYITGLSTQIANEALSPSINAGLNTHVHLLYTFTLPRKLHTPTPSLTLSLCDSLCLPVIHSHTHKTLSLSSSLRLSLCHHSLASGMFCRSDSPSCFGYILAQRMGLPACLPMDPCSAEWFLTGDKGRCYCIFYSWHWCYTGI